MTGIRTYSIANTVIGEVEVGPTNEIHIGWWLTRSFLQVRALEREASEVLSLIRSRRNRFAPINRIPPEVLTLIPDFWDKDVREQATITLTHVCRIWREIFISRSVLWTNFDCEDIDKTLIYLNRSGRSPINVQLERYDDLSPHDPFFQVVPHTTIRLKSVAIRGTPENVQKATVQLFHPAPLLESLTIEAKCENSPQRCPVIPTTLFNGDLSSLRELHLQSICTELPWRNMANLTSFTLGYTSLGDSSVGPLLDFFETAPRLSKIQLHLATPTTGAQRGRLVSLACLKRMDIVGGGPSSLLLDHLLIPVGAKFAGPLRLPSSLSRLWELSGFKAHVHIRETCPSIRFGGPGGRINVVPTNPRATNTCQVLECLARFDPSTVERLRLTGGNLMLQSGFTIRRVLFPMKHLRALTISRCKNVSHFIPTLDNIDMCPELEELVIDASTGGERIDVRYLMSMAATRASMSVKLKFVRIICRDKFLQASVLQLKEYVPRVESCLRAALASDDTDSSDEED